MSIALQEQIKSLLFRNAELSRAVADLKERVEVLERKEKAVTVRIGPEAVRRAEAAGRETLGLNKP
jgi:hypothetical protein